jgi:hypothetical protein
LPQASSKFLAEYVQWTLKGISKEAHEKERATTVKQLLSRIYGLLNHSNAAKRLGAYLAVKQFAEILKQNNAAHSVIIDQFLLELIHNCIMSLRHCALDQQSMGTEKAAVEALRVLQKIMCKKMPGTNETYAQIFLQERAKAKAPRRMHSDLKSFAEWAYSEIASHNKKSRRYCMEIMPTLLKVVQDGMPKKWVQNWHKSPGKSFAEVFEDRLLCDKNESLKTLTARCARLETALDVYEWILKGDYARPSDLFVKSDLPSCVDKFVSTCETVPSERTSTENELRLHRLQKSKCIYALAKLMNTAIASYGDIPSQLVSGPLLRMLFLCMLAPGRRLDLDTISDPVVDVEIPRMCKQLFSTLQDKEPFFDVMHQTLSDLLTASPELRLSDPEQTFAEVGRDGFVVLLHGHLHLFDVLGGKYFEDGKNDSQYFEDGKNVSLFERAVKQWAFEKHFKGKGAFEPSMKVLMRLILQLALRRLQTGHEVWNMFMDYDRTAFSSWQESSLWSFYLELREDFDSYFADHMDMLKGRLLKTIGKKDREFCVPLLLNVIDTQCRQITSLDQEKGTSRSEVLAIVQKANNVASACFDEAHSWVQKLMEPSQQASRKAAVDVLGRLMLLSSLLREHDVSHNANAEEATGLTGAKHLVFDNLMRICDNETPVDVLVHVFEVLPQCLCSTSSEQTKKMISKVEEVVADCLPLRGGSRLSLEERGKVVPLFKSLLRLVRTSKSRSMLPLVRKFLIDEPRHSREYLMEEMDSIRETLDEYILQVCETMR